MFSSRFRRSILSLLALIFVLSIGQTVPAGALAKVIRGWGESINEMAVRTAPACIEAVEYQPKGEDQKLDRDVRQVAIGCVLLNGGLMSAKLSTMDLTTLKINSAPQEVPIDWPSTFKMWERDLLKVCAISVECRGIYAAFSLVEWYRVWNEAQIVAQGYILGSARLCTAAVAAETPTKEIKQISAGCNIATMGIFVMKLLEGTLEIKMPVAIQPSASIAAEANTNRR